MARRRSTPSAGCGPTRRHRVLRRRPHLPLLRVHDLPPADLHRADRRRRRAGADGTRHRPRQAFHELKEGWHFIFVNPVVRAVNLGLATGLIGGGMLVPLGPVFSIRVLDAGTAGFGLFIFAMGSGVAIGVVLLSVFQKRLPKAAGLRGVAARRRRGPDRGGVDVVARPGRAVRRRCSGCAPARSTCSGSRCCTRASTTTSAAGSSARSTRWCGSACSSRSRSGPLLSDLLDKLSNRLVDRQISTSAASTIAVPGRAPHPLAGRPHHHRRRRRSPCASLRPARSGAGTRLRQLREEIVEGFTAPITEVKRSHDHPSAGVHPTDEEPAP